MTNSLQEVEKCLPFPRKNSPSHYRGSRDWGNSGEANIREVISGIEGEKRVYLVLTRAELGNLVIKSNAHASPALYKTQYFP